MSEFDILARPKSKSPCPEYKVKPRNSKRTLREFLTKDETEMHWLSLLKQLATRPKGPWKEMFAFYQANQSGDTVTFKPEAKKLIEKMLKALVKEWERQQEVENEEEDQEEVSTKASKKKQAADVTV